MNKLQIVKDTRALAAETLATTLKSVLRNGENISEIAFRDLWLQELRKHKKLLKDGWYDPPPHGIIVMFATLNDISRLQEKSYRNKICWPRDNIFLDFSKSILLLHASPIDKKTGATGDFGVTLYLGNDSPLQNHLKKSLQINRIIAEHAKENMPFADIATYAQQVIANQQMTSDLSSPSDPTGTNIGHSIPIASPTWSEINFKKSYNAGQQAVNDFIKQHRIFLNTKEKAQLKRGMGITIEPRPWMKTLPPAYFHSLLLIDENGRKEYIEEFDELFTIANMNYMLTN